MSFRKTIASRSHPLSRAFWAFMALMSVLIPTQTTAQVNVLTQHNDTDRTGNMA